MVYICAIKLVLRFAVLNLPLPSMSSTDKKDATDLQLLTPVQYLPGVGPQRAARFEKLGVITARDLLFLFPRDYQDMSQICTAAELCEGQPASLVGVIEEVDLRNTGPGRCLFAALIRVAGDHVRGIWFNQPYIADRLRESQRVLISGTPKRQGLRWEFVHPRIQPLGPDEQADGKILPVYPLTEGLKQADLRRVTQTVVSQLAAEIDDVLPVTFRDQHQLCSIHEALCQIHQPTDQSRLTAARRRFVFQELFVLQLALAFRRAQQVSRGAIALQCDARVDARIRRLFSFPLTAGQEDVIRDITNDMSRQQPMNRLLQGDVASGKTVVAIYAMLVAVVGNYQAALMAPTEVLARQHYESLSKVLSAADVRVALLTGSLTPAQRRDTVAAIERGDVDLLVGTQAMVHADIAFPRLGLVVIDEQHKFGVRQRAGLRGDGPQPHYLVMTATPIPRTVAMIAYGDLDISVLRDHPPGRQTIHTYFGDQQQRAKWWEFFCRKLREGRQGYVITPVIESDEDSNLTSLEASFEALSNGELEAFRVDLIHGGMPADRKQQAMDDFRHGKTQVLVATSVIEVGVDVPNASVMTIENGERFGLAQLHQLRGRVGRGAHPGYVCVFSDGSSDEVRERLAAFQSTTDGFRLAELDYEMRGPGDVLGTRQHGLPPLRVADVLRDQGELLAARDAARRLIAEDPLLSNTEFAGLRRQVLVRYGEVLELGDAG